MELDRAIVRHLELLNEYASVQAQLQDESSLAFISLSRARYHGITLASDSFPPQFARYLSVKHKKAQEPDETIPDAGSMLGDLPQQVSSSKTTQDDRLPASEVDSLTAELSRTELKEAVVNQDVQQATESMYKERRCSSDIWQLDCSTNRKLNPIRVIEVLPSSKLRQTQKLFNVVVETTVRLANIVKELRETETIIAKLSRLLREKPHKDTSEFHQLTTAEVDSQTLVSHKQESV